MKSFRPRLCRLLAWSLLFASALIRADGIPAFSGAEGFGAITPGGRGGAVIHVTNLDDRGPGSFRAAVTAKGPRTVVFDVSGIIWLESELSIREPFLTIAGHTAPGDGVIIANETVSLDAHDIIIRYMRFRRGVRDQEREDDALGSDATRGNIIIDHVSTSWGLDENISLYRNKQVPALPDGNGSTVLPARNLTIQWTISSEALNINNHAFGSTIGGAGANFHHNLWASNTARNPSLSFSFFLDFRNNVHFNWRHRSMDGAGPEAHVNVINSYYKSGPATEWGVRNRIVKPEIRDGVREGGVGEWYVDGNYVVNYPAVTADNWNGGVQFEQDFPKEWARVDEPHVRVVPEDDPDDLYDDDGSGDVPGRGNPLPIELPVIATETADDAYATVLARSGATLPVRDAVDQRITESVASGRAPAGPGRNGIIYHPDEVGGYPAIAEVKRPASWDTDRDGMPDGWESRHGLDPNDPADRNGDFDDDGFTNLEEYLNELGAFAAVEPIVWDGSQSERYAEIGNWSIAFQPSRLDTVVIDQGRAVVDAMAQHAGLLRMAPEDGASALLEISGGHLAVAETVDTGVTATIEVDSGGRLSVGGDFTNAGTLRLTGDAVLKVGGTFRNTGTLDLTAWNGTLPSGWVNEGTVLGESAIDLVSVEAAEDGMTFLLQGIAGRSYQLQARQSLSDGEWQDVGVPVVASEGQFSIEQAFQASDAPRYFRLIATSP